MWAKWKAFEQECLFSDTLKSIRLEIERKIADGSWEVTYDIKDDPINGKTLILYSGRLRLALYAQSSMRWMTHVDLGDTNLPENVISVFLNRGDISSSIIYQIINCYGAKSKPWKERIDEDLYLETTKLGTSWLAGLDALQELCRRSKNKTALYTKTGLDVTKCYVTDIWIEKRNGQVFKYLKENMTSFKVAHIFSMVKEYDLHELFIVHAGLMYDRNQEFVNIKNPTKRGNGKNIVNDGNYIPLWYFNSKWAKVGCGHYEHVDKVIENLCQVCLTKISPTGAIIGSYSLRAPKFLKFQQGDVKKGKFSGELVYYGFELELENGSNSEAIKMYKGVKDYIICKNDGSIHAGFEIVTTPAVYEVHQEKAKTLFSIIKEQTNMRADSNCGLHFHVSRNALTPLQIGKQLEFIYNPSNRKFITDIAGRDNSTYARFDATHTITDLAPENYNRGSGVRYEAINLTNQDTIEFRIFASTTDYEVFMSRLDFVKAMIDYTKPCAVPLKSLKDIKEKDNFIKFLEGNKKQYPFLTQQLGIRKPIPAAFIGKITKKGIK